MDLSAFPYCFAASSGRDRGGAHGDICTGCYDFESGKTRLWEFARDALVPHHDRATQDGFYSAMHTVLGRYSSASSA